MAKTKQIQQRFPEPLLAAIDTWAGENMTRTDAINLMCQTFLDNIEIERLRMENAELRQKVVNMAMAGCKASAKCNQVIE